MVKVKTTVLSTDRTWVWVIIRNGHSVVMPHVQFMPHKAGAHDEILLLAVLDLRRGVKKNF